MLGLIQLPMKHFTENQLGKFLKDCFRCLSLETQKVTVHGIFPDITILLALAPSPLLKLTCFMTPHSVSPKWSVSRGKIGVNKAGDRHCLQW